MFNIPLPQNSQKAQESSAEEEKRTAEAILNSESLRANLCIMERVVTRNIYQAKQVAPPQSYYDLRKVIVTR